MLHFDVVPRNIRSNSNGLWTEDRAITSLFNHQSTTDDGRRTTLTPDDGRRTTPTPDDGRRWRPTTASGTIDPPTPLTGPRPFSLVILSVRERAPSDSIFRDTYTDHFLCTKTTPPYSTHHHSFGNNKLVILKNSELLFFFTNYLCCFPLFHPLHASTTRQFQVHVNWLPEKEISVSETSYYLTPNYHHQFPIVRLTKTFPKPHDENEVCRL